MCNWSFQRWKNNHFYRFDEGGNDIRMKIESTEGTVLLVEAVDSGIIVNLHMHLFQNFI